jgi:hypothetical protein
MNDLRLAIGIFFTLVGAVLVVLGIIHPDARAALTAANVNLYSGLTMLVFGTVMLWLARRAF